MGAAEPLQIVTAGPSFAETAPAIFARIANVYLAKNAARQEKEGR